MKLLLFIVAFVFLLQSTTAQFQQICKFCSGELQIPTDWPEFQRLLKIACSWLVTAPKECTALVQAAELNSSYDKMYPHIVELKDFACDKFRSFC